MKIKSFLFLPNGETLNHFRNRADELVKEKYCKTLKVAKNTLCMEEFGLPFSKTMFESHSLSPRLISGALYVPVIKNLEFDGHEDRYFYYCIAITRNGIKLGGNNVITFNDKLPDNAIENLTQDDIKVIPDGWSVNIGHLSVLIVGRYEDQIKIQVTGVRNGDENKIYSLEDKTLITTNGIEISKLENMLTLDGMLLTNHAHSETEILQINGLKLNLVGAFTFIVDGKELTLNDMMVEIKNKGGSLRNFRRWLSGGNANEYSHVQIRDFPKFQFKLGDKDIGDPFYRLPNLLSRISLLASMAIVNEG